MKNQDMFLFMAKVLCVIFSFVGLLYHIIEGIRGYIDPFDNDKMILFIILMVVSVFARTEKIE